MEQVSQALAQNPPRSGGIVNSSKISALSPRQSLLATVAEMIRKLKCLPLMERAERESTVRSWELALVEIPDADLLPVFQRAAQGYTDVSKPFGVPQMLAAFDLLRAERQREQRLREIEADRTQAREHAASRFVCEHCRDRRVQIIRHADGYSSAKACECAGGTRALRKEDGWMTSAKGEWYRASWGQPHEEYCTGCGVLKDHGRCEMCD